MVMLGAWIIAWVTGLSACTIVLSLPGAYGLALLVLCVEPHCYRKLRSVALVSNLGKHLLDFPAVGWCRNHQRCVLHMFWRCRRQWGPDDRGRAASNLQCDPAVHPPRLLPCPPPLLCGKTGQCGCQWNPPTSRQGRMRLHALQLIFIRKTVVVISATT